MTTKKIYIGIDNEVIEATGEALEYILDFQAKAKKRKEAEAQAELDKAAAKAAAEAKLVALGLTSDDLKALGL
jgi:hypothetical protein